MRGIAKKLVAAIMATIVIMVAALLLIVYSRVAGKERKAVGGNHR